VSFLPFTKPVPAGDLSLSSIRGNPS